MREIRRKYTKSELMLIAWDSKQKSYNLSKQFKDRSSSSNSDAPSTITNGIRETDNAYELPEGINGGVAIPKKFFNKEGELDLRLATGDEACGYLRALGVNIVPRIKF